MLTNSIYDDIAARTGGDVYIGVVGPVRTGKSTFIKKFMETSVLDQVSDKNKRKRMIDELPQSADGKTIMTTEPKFVPNEAVEIRFDKMTASVRLIDCVGYVVEGALGQSEGEKPRLVKTPWQDEEMPFEKAAEIGTEKVICDHSTVGVLVTTDGTITEIGRAKYVDAEEKAVKKLKECGKPFVIVVNSKTPDSTDSVRLKESLEERYSVPVLLIDVAKLTQEDVKKIMAKILYEFPVRCVRMRLPKWMRSLGFESDLIKKTILFLKESAEGINKMSDYDKLDEVCAKMDLFVSTDTDISLSDGCIDMKCTPPEETYYKEISSCAGKEITDDYDLLTYVKKLAASYDDYEGIRKCMAAVSTDGYGVVEPKTSDMELAEPELVKKGSRYGVRLKASAPSYHIIRVDVDTEVSPTIGSEKQGEDLAKSLLADFENDKQALWQTNMFGMSLSDLVKEDLSCKLAAVSTDTRKKLRRTMTRIVNEGKGGVLCILL